MLRSATAAGFFVCKIFPALGLNDFHRKVQVSWPSEGAHVVVDSLQFPERGYPVYFDDLPVSTGPPAEPLAAGEGFELRADNTRSRRVIFYDVWNEHRGIDDRMSAIAKWLSFATQADANLAFPDPNSSLSDGHGISTANWWTDYYLTVPPLYRFKEVRCSQDAEEFNITNFSDLRTWPPRALHALHSKSMPLCIRLQVGPATSDHATESMANFIAQGARRVSIWTSPKVTKLVREVQRELPRLSTSYNAIHVRLGDKLRRGGVLCNNATYVVERMERLCGMYPDYKDSPWLLMSDGDDAFFHRMNRRASRKGIRIVSEQDVKSLNAVEDNFLRYTALECLWGNSDIGLSTYKNIGGRCKMGPTHRGGGHLLNCLPKE